MDLLASSLASVCAHFETKLQHMFGLGHVEIHRTSEDSFAGPQLLLGLNHIGAQTTSAFPFCSLIDGGMMERIDQTKTGASAHHAFTFRRSHLSE